MIISSPAVSNEEGTIIFRLLQEVRFIIIIIPSNDYNGSVLTLANRNYLYIKGNSMNSINSNARDNLNHAVVIVGWDDNYDK